MQNIDVPYTGYALPEPTVSAMSPEDIKPDIASPPNNTSPPSQPAMRLPWMQDESFSAAPSPQQAYTPQDIKTESEAFDDDMNVDEEDDEDAEGEMDDEFEPDEAVELTFEERMRLRFPTFEKEKPLKFTDLTALNPIREVKRRKLEDHPSQLHHFELSLALLTPLTTQSLQSKRSIPFTRKKQAFCNQCRLSRA
jgi:hypothetical protein